MIHSLRYGPALTALALLALAAGCETDSNPVAPKPPPAPTLQNLWPNGNGGGWTYRLVQRGWQDTAFHYYPSAADVPAAPSMTALRDIAGVQPIGPSASSDTARFTLRFSGTITTGAGVTAQNLTSTMAGYPAPGLAVSAHEPALARLARARPDLAARLGLAASTRGLRALPRTIVDFPTFLHGGAWKRDTAWVGTYSDFDTVPAFHFLRTNFAVGTEFSIPMYPTLAPDVILHALVLPPQLMTTPAGRFTNPVVVLYLIDYGVGHYTQGYWRELDYGIIAYAPAVGPVWSYERVNVEAGSPLSIGGGDATLMLTGRLR